MSHKPLDFGAKCMYTEYMTHLKRLILFSLISVLIYSCSKNDEIVVNVAEETPSTATATFTPLALPSPTLTTTPTRMSTATPTPSPTFTPTLTPSATEQPMTYLSNLLPSAEEIGFGTLGRGVYPFDTGPQIQGPTIFSRNQFWPHSLFAHAPSVLTYDLGARYTTFRASILMVYPVELGDECSDGTIFIVQLDRREAYRNPVITNYDDPVFIELDVRGVKELRLIVNESGHNGCDYSLSGEPILLKGDQYALSPSTPTPPNLPCSDPTQDGNYLFLDCEDIRRIRNAYYSDDPDFMEKWAILTATVDDYRRHFPTQYDPDASWNVLWWGAGNFIARDMAILYLTTGDESYANDILKLIELVRDHTPFYSQLTNFDQRMPSGEEFSGGILSHPQFGSVALQSIMFAYLSIRDSAVMNAEQRSSYDRFFINQARLLEQAAIFRGNDTALDSPINRNVSFNANVATLTYALAFSAAPSMQDLTARVRPRLEWQIAHWWEADRGWGENTEGYGYSVLEGLILYAETLLKTQQEDLYSRSFDGISIHAMCSFYLAVLTPEGTSPALNDTAHYFMDPGLLTVCGQRYDDPTLLFAAQRYGDGRASAYGVNSMSWITPFHAIAWAGLTALEPQQPGYTSVVLPATGAVILRSGWGQNDPYALLQFTSSRVHQDFAFGNLLIYDHGPWMVSNGYMGASGNPTDQHNTVSLDGRNHTSTGGQIVAFADLIYTGMASVEGTPYKNLLQTRTLLWLKPWSQWVVVDDLEATDAQQHTLETRWYVRANTDLQETRNWSFQRNNDGYHLWVQFLPQLPAAYRAIQRQTAWEKWVNDAEGVEQIVTTSLWPLRLVSVVTSGKAPDMPVVERVEEDSTTLIRSHRDSGELWEEWWWLMPKDPDGTNQAVTGVAACLHWSGTQMQGYCLAQGTNLTWDGIQLLLTEQPVSVEISFVDGQMVMDTIHPAEVTVYWPLPITSVSEAGILVPYAKDGDSLTLFISKGRHTFSITP